MRSLIRAFASHLNILMTVKLLTEQQLEFLRLKGGYTGSSEFTLVSINRHLMRLITYVISTKIPCAGPYLHQGSYRQVCVKFKDFSRTS